MLSADGATADQDRRISETIAREQTRLRQFIHVRVPDDGDAEDIIQEVFYELVAAYRLMKPVEQVLGSFAWHGIGSLTCFEANGGPSSGPLPCTYQKTARRIDGKTCFRRRMRDPRPLMRAACYWNNWTLR